jgi:radical SAM protein (TIGR01212 family)
LTSTFPQPAQPSENANWRAAGHRYYPYPFFLHNRFGGRVQRISLDARFTCPNVDGSVTTGGCVFCNNDSFSPSRRLSEPDLYQQLEQGIQRVQRRYQKCRQFIAYFQPATNTYAPVGRLRAFYEQPLLDTRVVGLSIGTRPDCVPDEVLDLLTEFAQRTYVSVEFGMQTMHDRSLDWMNRGHDHAATVDAIQRSRGRGFEIGVHVILGLPGETADDWRATAREVARLDVDAVKIHNLYAVQGTRFGRQVSAGEVQVLDQNSYIQGVVDFLERLPPRVIVQRVSGDAPDDYLIAPDWCRHKNAIRQAVQVEFERRDSWQGKLYGASAK